MSESKSDLERALQALTPAAPVLDRDRLMFLAGQAGRGPTLPWKVTSGIFAIASVVLAVLLVVRPAPEIQVVTVVVPAPVPKEFPLHKPKDSPSPEQIPVQEPYNRLPDLASYRLQQQIMRFGAESLPSLSDPGALPNEPPVTVDRIGKMSPTTTPMNLFPWQ
jgi:hypothetical protein